MKKKLVILILIILLVLLLIYYNNEKSYVTFTFDDGYEEHYTVVFPIFEKHNVVATDYIITGLVGASFEDQNLMDWDQIKELRDNGWEIGSHTINHKYLTTLNDEEIKEELKASKEALEEQGFDVKSLSIPYGDYNDNVRAIAEENYEYVRTSYGGTNTFSNIDKYNIKAYTITNSTSLEDIKTVIDEAKKNKQWLVIMVHLVRDDKRFEYSVSPEDLENIIIYIKQKNMEIKTLSEVFEIG